MRHRTQLLSCLEGKLQAYRRLLATKIHLVNQTIRIVARQAPAVLEKLKISKDAECLELIRLERILARLCERLVVLWEQPGYLLAKWTDGFLTANERYAVMSGHDCTFIDGLIDSFSPGGITADFDDRPDLTALAEEEVLRCYAEGSDADGRQMFRCPVTKELWPREEMEVVQFVPKSLKSLYVRSLFPKEVMSITHHEHLRNSIAVHKPVARAMNKGDLIIVPKLIIWGPHGEEDTDPEEGTKPNDNNSQDSSDNASIDSNRNNVSVSVSNSNSDDLVLAESYLTTTSDEIGPSIDPLPSVCFVECRILVPDQSQVAEEIYRLNGEKLGPTKNKPHATFMAAAAVVASFARKRHAKPDAWQLLGEMRIRLRLAVRPGIMGKMANLVGAMPNDEALEAFGSSSADKREVDRAQRLLCMSWMSLLWRSRW
ncbi:hypothetical protein ESCO_001474 [Escovopsis weberi]|uniref:Uncharacterized protein n=1 Tax=Escovopsis weberi TaxID=150374 RepID=A0A0M8N7C4_ESCWE|nr:hypothetical protein ESCO_001474 [Escovopsis weberi]